MSTPYLEKFLKDGGKPKKGSVIALERLQIHRFQEELCYRTKEASNLSLSRRVMQSH
jgi:hypothetical protein